ncbi:hypothetical protein NMG60_11008216 [Bertholletia excelsa]
MGIQIDANRLQLLFLSLFPLFPPVSSTFSSAINLSIKSSLFIASHVKMARALYQTLIRCPQSASYPAKFPPTRDAARLVARRTQSSQTNNFQRSLDGGVVDSDADQRETLAVQKIEDAIHRIIVKRSAPDWLPFVPGSSYWVPPRRSSYGIAQLVDKMANALSDEEVMSIATSRGWPSSAFFLNDATSDPTGTEATSKNMSESKDED